MFENQNIIMVRKELELLFVSIQEISFEEKIRMSSVLSFQKKFINPKKDIKCIVEDVASNYDKSFKSILIGSEVLKQLLFSSLFGIPMSLQFQKAVYRLTKERLINVAANFPAFQQLSMRLQENCLRNNMPFLIAIRAATSSTSGKPEDHMRRSCGPEDSLIAKNMISEVAKERPPRVPLKILSRNQNFEFRDMKSKEKYDFLKNLVYRNIGHDQNIIILMSYISLFSCNNDTIRTGEDEIKKLQSIQENLILILQRYIYATYDLEATTCTLTKSIETLVALNEVQYLFKNLTID